MEVDVEIVAAAGMGLEWARLTGCGVGPLAGLVLGAAEIYVHAGGQYEWDSGAPVAVALASGLHASRLNGDPLRYGAPDAWLPDLTVCRRELADAVLAVTTQDYRPYY